VGPALANGNSGNEILRPEILVAAFARISAAVVLPFGHFPGLKLVDQPGPQRIIAYMPPGPFATIKDLLTVDTLGTA